MGRVTTFSADELEQLVFLTTRVCCYYRDPRRGPLTLAYAYAETSDNEDSSLICASALAQSGMTRSIGICDGATDAGYPGFTAWSEKLTGFGVGSIPIVPIRVGGGFVNTRVEATTVIECCRGLKGDLGIIAPAFHLLRAFMTTIAELRKANFALRVYPMSGAGVPWLQHVRHSQGKDTDTRAGFLASELARIERYAAPEFGGMPSPREVLEYLNWRDS